MVKLIYIINVIGQFFILDSVLDSPFSTYGFAVMGTHISDSAWESSPNVIFPRVTMCDFNIRRLGNVHRYTVQCALPINLYNEKIFLFLWFWFVFVSIVSIIDFLTWLGRTCVRNDRISYAQGHLSFTYRLKDDYDAQLCVEFVDNYLRQDGIFLMRLIGHNTNRYTVSELIGALWDKWLKSPYVSTKLIPTIKSNMDKANLKIEVKEEQEIEIDTSEKTTLT